MKKLHPRLRLGKAKPKLDKRTLLLSAMLKPKLAPAPLEFLATKRFPEIPVLMDANDTHGCCVISARAKQTRLFERIEQGVVVPVTDKDILREYLRLTGGADSGLVMLDALNAWRQKGWRVGKDRYGIAAFAAVDFEKVQPGTYPSEEQIAKIRSAIYYMGGLQVGLDLPISASEQFDAGHEWCVAEGREAKPGSWGGHAVFIVGYDQNGPICETWGARQHMDWFFFFAYCDEAYVVVDDKDRQLGKKSPIDVNKMKEMLAAVTA